MIALLCLARTFWGDRRAHAALEFALIAPAMVMLLLMSVDVVDMVQMNKRLGTLSGSISDLVARDVTVSDEEMSDILATASQMLSPSHYSDLGVRVTSIAVDDEGHATVIWSERLGGYDVLTPGSSVSLPEAMRLPNTSTIRAESSVSYSSTLGWLTPTARNLERVEYRRPRVADPVTRDATP